MPARFAVMFPLLAAVTAVAEPMPEPAAGLEARLVAREPLLSSPSDIDVDARGRIWVCEVLNYRGKQETRPEGDRILVLEDADGDGTADRQTVFHQGRDVDSALGICVIGEGPGRKVIVSCAPDVFVFHDDDGDLRADRRESLFTKTGMPQHDHSVHAFVVGPDGRWYFNFGNTGQAVHDRDGNPVRDRFGNVVNDSGRPYRQGMVFRCRPDGGDFEVLGHNFRNNYEVAVDSFGGLWQSDNDDDGTRSARINFVMEHGNFGYVDERTGAGWQAPRTNLEAAVPDRHWHQNDPGVVPNLLLTGGVSPTGICVYEGSLLPQRFVGAVVHCDAGPRVVRAYHVRPSGAGYAAEAETILEGAADEWFRPSDVCVAPDGSLIVADWHDPGVGGHGMGDTEKGRIYRIAPSGAAWMVPPVDCLTVDGAVAALSSPNNCTRATALERLATDPAAAKPALERARAAATDPRLRARLAWAQAMLPGAADAVIAALAAEDDDMRIVALRICRRVQGDVLGLVERLAASPSAAVRRESAIALRGVAGERADRAWADLASRHTAGDRWGLEALGIGADAVTGCGTPGAWDGRLAAWLARVGDGWKSPAGREIVWRSRAAATSRMLCALCADAEVPPSESLRLVRALDFQDDVAATAAVRDIVPGLAAPPETLRAILPEFVRRLDPGAGADAALARRIEEAVALAAGTPDVVAIVERFSLVSHVPDLMAVAGDPHATEQTAATAARVSLGLDGAAVRAAVLAADQPAAVRLLAAVGGAGLQPGLALLEELVSPAGPRADLNAAAVLGLARSQRGAERLVDLAKEGRLAGPLAQTAAAAIATCPWQPVKAAAAGVLPLPQPKGGGELPTVDELVARRGDPERGRDLFAGPGTCAKCHVVGGVGRMVGPDLSGVGAKLSRAALYEAILAPSAAISHTYETYTALLDDGRSLTGLLVSRSPAEVVIRGTDGIDTTLPAAAVEQLVRQPVSLMPADLATMLSVQELVDVVAWMETLTAR